MKKTMYIFLGLSLLLITGCGKEVKLEDGSTLIAEFNGVQITAEDLYEQLKELNGIGVLINYIDEELFGKMFEDDEEVILNTENYLAYIKQQYGDSFLESMQEQGFENEEAVREYLLLEFKKEKAVLEYVEETLSDKEINAYYEDEIVGDVKASHILIAPETTDEMTETEISNAEANALEQAKEIITKLNNGEDFATLAKEYSDDEGNSENGGDLGWFNKNDMVDEFEEAAYNLESNTYSKTPVKTQFGYHIILVTDKRTKPELNLVIDTIKDSLAKEKLDETPELYDEAIAAIRKENGLEIYDTNLDSKYTDLLK